MTAYLVDTDVLIDHLRGARAFSLRHGDDGAYSVITRAELYEGKSAAPEPIEALLAALVEVPIDGTLATRAGSLRRRHGLNLADAMIAATALVTARTVMSRNIRHYNRVPELQVAEPPG